MRRVWRNMTKGKKIAGLLVLCAAVVLGYFGFHRLVVRADEYDHHGVINDIKRLPTNISANEGSAENPFLILEIVPSVDKASIGYMIDGCEPIDFDVSDPAQCRTKYGDIGYTVIHVFDDEYEHFGTEEETKTAFPGEWYHKDAPVSVSMYGYYEKVKNGEGNFKYIGNYQDKSKYLADTDVYRPDFEEVEFGNGDFIWVSCIDPDINSWQKSLSFDPAAKAENKRDATDKQFTFEEGDREYTERKGTSHYYGNQQQMHGVHRNDFLRTSLGKNADCYTREQIKNYNILVKTIEPKELSQHPEWIDYADLIFMSRSASSVASYWTTYSNQRRIENTGTAPVDNFCQNGQDFSWRVARTLFMKVNALEKYSGDGKDGFRFAPMLMDYNVVKGNYYNSPGNTTTYYLDYATMTSDTSIQSASNQGSNYNIWKFLVMNLSMKQETFYDLFFKSKNKEGKTVIPEEPNTGKNEFNEKGICTAQINDNAKEYWSYYTFFPSSYADPKLSNEDKMATQQFYNLYPSFELGQGTDNANVGLNGATFQFNADNLISQLSNTAQLPNNSATQDAFDWFKEEYEDDFNSSTLSPVQMIHYLLNYKKKGNSDENEKDRNKIPIRILEIEPCNDFIWKEDSHLIAALFPSSRFTTEVDHMTTQQFNGAKTDLSSDYDLVYIGMETGKLNTTENITIQGDKPHNLTEFDTTDRVVDYNDANYKSNTNFGLAGKVYLHVGDQVRKVVKEKGEDGTESEQKVNVRSSGNDISSLKKDELQKFVLNNAGVLILDDILASFKSMKYTRTVDSSSYLSSLIEKVDGRDNIKALKSVKNNVSVLLKLLTDSKSSYKQSQMEIAGTPPECVKLESASKAVSGASVTKNGGESYQKLNSSVLNFTFHINKLDVNKFKQKGITLPDGINGKQFGVKLYLDIDYNGAISNSELIYDSKEHASKYNMPSSYGNDPGSYAFSIDFAQVYKDRKLAERKSGALTWKFVIYDVSDDGYYVTKTGTSWYRAGGAEKMKVKFCQIVADDAALGTPADLTSNTLFSQWTNSLADYEIDAESKAISFNQATPQKESYVSIYSDMKLVAQQNAEIAAHEAAEKEFLKDNYPDIPSGEQMNLTAAEQQEIDEKAAQKEQEIFPEMLEEALVEYFQDYDMIIVSCAKRMQEEAKTEMTINSLNTPISDAVRFLKKLGDSGFTVLYTTESVSREKVSGAQAVTDNIKNMLNQSRFTDTSVSFDQDIPSYSQGKQTNGNKLAKTDSYKQTDYESLEYTYKAVMQSGSASEEYNKKKCFNNNLWKDNVVKYGAGNNAVKTTKITQSNGGKLTTYPYAIDKEVDITDTAAQDYQLNMNNPGMTVWHCLGGGEDSLYGISPNDATNNYYLYTVGNVIYTSANLGSITGDMEMKLFVNTLIAGYDVTSVYPRVVVDKVKGISSSNTDADLKDSATYSNTDSTLYFDAIMPQLKEEYLDYNPLVDPMITMAPLPTPNIATGATSSPDDDLLEPGSGTSTPASGSGVSQVLQTPEPNPEEFTIPEWTQSFSYGEQEAEREFLNGASSNGVLRIRFHANSEWAGTEKALDIKFIGENREVSASVLYGDKDWTKSHTQLIYLGNLQKNSNLGKIKRITSINVHWATVIDDVTLFYSEEQYNDYVNPSNNNNSASHDPNKVKKVVDASTFDQYTDEKDLRAYKKSYIPTGKDFTHKIFFTPYDTQSSSGNIHSLRISLIEKGNGTDNDKVFGYFKNIFFQDVTGNVFKYIASADGTFTIADKNFLKDSRQYFFLYKEKYILTNYHFVKFEIENTKKKGTTYLDLYNDVQQDNTYVFPLD